MPLLQSIVQELDGELTRLQTLRKIVASLNRTPALVRRYTEATSKPAAAVIPAARAPKAPKPPRITKAARPTRKPRKDAGTRRGPNASRTAEAPRALARVVPSGPVVFYPGKRAEALPAEALPAEVAAADIEQNSVALVDPHPVDQPPVDLDAQSRQLAARWGAGPTL